MAIATIDDESALISASRQGDRGALDQLLRLHYDRVYAVCRRIAGNDADADDATQEALLAIVRGLDKYDGRAKFSTWAYRVATNACLDELRRRGRRPTPGLPDYESTDLAGSDRPELADQISDRLTLDDAIRQLPEEFRVAVVLRDQLAMDYAEIAETLEIPAGTVRSRIARGRSRLAAYLTDDTNHRADGTVLPAGTVSTDKTVSTDSSGGESGNQTDPTDRPNNQP